MREDRLFESPHRPPTRFAVPRGDVPIGKWRTIQRMIRRGAGEREVDSFIRKDVRLLAGCPHFERPNPHMSWVIPQAEIRPSIGDKRGLRPDYLIGGSGSDGVKWCVVELKSPSDKIFVSDRRESRLRLSNAANRGICQLAAYIDYCAAQQPYLKELLRSRTFSEPHGILFIGRRDEFEGDEARQQLKAAWNRMFAGRIQIRTFDAFATSLVW